MSFAASVPVGAFGHRRVARVVSCACVANEGKMGVAREDRWRVAFELFQGLSMALGFRSPEQGINGTRGLLRAFEGTITRGR